VGAPFDSVAGKVIFDAPSSIVGGGGEEMLAKEVGLR
jgi:hypothetical protein